MKNYFFLLFLYKLFYFSFKLVKFRNSKIGNNGMKEICDALSNLTSLQRLDLNLL